jgi:hypothetical protein
MTLTDPEKIFLIITSVSAGIAILLAIYGTYKNNQEK